MTTRNLWLVPVLAALVAHAVVLPGDFVFDDTVLLEQDAGVREFSFERIFLEDYWGSARVSTNWRPLVLLTYSAQFLCSPAEWTFHAFNVILNAAVALLAYAVLRRLLDDAALAAVAATLWTLLPIHVEAVAGIVGRAELLAAASVLGSWLLALRDERPEEPQRGANAGVAVAIGVLTFVGLLAKESAAVVPAVLLVSAWTRRRRVPWAAVAAGVLAIALFVVCWRSIVTDRPGTPSLVDNPLAHVSAAERVVNAMALQGVYLWKTVFPLRLSADYSYAQLPARPLSDPVLWSLLTGAALVLLLPAALAWRRRPLAATGALLWIVAFSPTANVLFPIGTVFGERLAFLPSFGVALALAAGSAPGGGPRARKACIIALGFLSLLYGVRTAARTVQWRTATGLYLETALDAPRSTRSHLLAAGAYAELARRAQRGEPSALGTSEQLLERATRSLERSLEILPDHARALLKLGQVRLMREDYAGAEETLTRAIAALEQSRIPEPLALRLRAQARLRRGRHVEARGDLERYFALREALGGPPDAIARNYLALALGMAGELQAALKEFDRALAISAIEPEIWNNRGFCRARLGDPAGAIADYERGLRLCRERGQLYSSRGFSEWAFWRRIAAIHRQQGRARQAEEAEQQAARARAEAARLPTR